MPLYIEIDFRKNGQLGAWWSHDEPATWRGKEMTSDISETRIRDVLIALANQIDPEESAPEPAAVDEATL